MLHDGRDAIVVDPGDSTPVIAALAATGLALAGILVTHHHADHVGGVDALRPLLKGVVHGPAREPIPQPFVPLLDGDRVEVAEVSFDVLDVPGHTAGHIAYFHAAHGGQPPIVFCGDTLFSGGCGRLFEGTSAQMNASLQRLASLPADTRVCCAHEYTLANLRFAHAVDPDNDELAAYTRRCETLRAQGLPTLPGCIGQERLINPFLRCGELAVVQAARRHGAASDGEADVVAALRQWKNNFR